MGAIGQHEKAWTEFWRDQGQGNACCANAPEIQRPVYEHWSAFARTLPAGARVLDLGCGSGAAAHALLAANPMLRITGIDFAAVPASGDPRLDIRASTRMEKLPFADASFDAAVSQFGFEYASVEDAARELARVLRSDAPFSFLVHHSNARIATDSVPHRKALEAICGPQLEAAFLSGNATALDRQLAQIHHEFPRERVVAEAGQGLCRHIGLPLPHRQQIWGAVMAALAPELVMLASLEMSWVGPEEMDIWQRPLAARFKLNPSSVVTMTNGNLLCWKIEGLRSGTLH